jgi:hypothetical protein
MDYNNRFTFFFLKQKTIGLADWVGETFPFLINSKRMKIPLKIKLKPAV